jgi:ribosomal protein S12 methylthiotransferase
MNRRGRRAEIEALIGKIRAKVPEITLRTTLIAGFPGETEAQFAELCQFVKDLRFDRLGCFAYSAEEETPAAGLPGQIEEQVKIDRSELVMAEQMNIMAQKNEAMIGKQMMAVVEGFDRFGECFFGRTEMDAPDIDGKIFFQCPGKLAVGQFVKVKITDTLDLDLIGEVVQ